MDIFSWLIVGHLIGDWLCQNDWMARSKQKRFFNAAILVHSCVYTAAIMGGIGLDRSDPGRTTLLLVAVYVFVSHWIIDVADLAVRWEN